MRLIALHIRGIKSHEQASTKSVIREVTIDLYVEMPVLLAKVG